jgi:hypothetical protein
MGITDPYARARIHPTPGSKALKSDQSEMTVCNADASDTGDVPSEKRRFT